MTPDKPQTDPIMGLHDWENFMKGVKVLTWVAAEPRRRTPIEVLGRILDVERVSAVSWCSAAFFGLGPLIHPVRPRRSYHT